MALHSPPASPDLVGTAEVCRILGINPATVGRWATAGKLVAAHKLPGKNGAYLFRREDVEALAAQRESEASA